MVSKFPGIIIFHILLFFHREIIDYWSHLTDLFNGFLILRSFINPVFYWDLNFLLYLSHQQTSVSLFLSSKSSSYWMWWNSCYNLLLTSLLSCSFLSIYYLQKPRTALRSRHNILLITYWNPERFNFIFCWISSLVWCYI